MDFRRRQEASIVVGNGVVARPELKVQAIVDGHFAVQEEAEVVRAFALVVAQRAARVVRQRIELDRAVLVDGGGGVCGA